MTVVNLRNKLLLVFVALAFVPLVLVSVINYRSGLGAVGELLRARLADVCVLPASGETVWWRDRGRFDMRFRGHHGGLSDDEARTQVAALVA